jgi:hypothetical protein
VLHHRLTEVGDADFITDDWSNVHYIVAVALVDAAQTDTCLLCNTVI